jgi:trehalose/maltose hydrolase-like predicted phosphorylase
MSAWTVVYDGFDPSSEMLRETLCALGNGYFVTRGAAEFADADGEVHYPGTYLAGGYNRLATRVAGREVVNEDLVNLPNWLCLDARPAGAAWFDPGEVELLAYRQELDMASGVLHRTIRSRDPEGRETTLESRRIVHMSKPHLAGIELTITAHNWSGRVEVRSALDGTVENAGVARYRGLASRHLVPVESGGAGDVGILLVVETSQSRLRVAQAARTRVCAGTAEVDTAGEIDRDEAYVAEVLSFDVAERTPVRVEKIVALYTCRDRGISEPALEARAAIARAGTFADLTRSHSRAWARLWRRGDVRVEEGTLHEGDMPLQMAQRILRLNVFHVLQTVSPNTVDLDVGVPARGWHGEAYRGHIFWDELFILPFLNLRWPEISEALLRYRHRRLDEARVLARDAGYRGAMYPWQSGSNGAEETQVVHLNPRSGRWLPDASHRQRHVNGAIAYNVWQHYRTTGHDEFLHVFGAEMILEIAVFFASIAHYDPDRDRFEIHGVMGPDEYHDGYPDADSPGLNNNAFTNVLAAWVADVALRVLDELVEDRRAELRESIGVSDEDVGRWADMRHKMFVPFHDGEIISQFEGYERLEEFDWDGYRRRYGDISRLDRILEAEGDTPNRYKVSKQADVLMLAYLFRADELCKIFQRLCYPFDEDTLVRNYDYYCSRTSHGSTLSQVVHGALTVCLRPEEIDRTMFAAALRSDIDDIQGGATREGIHLGAMAATVDTITSRVFGLGVRDGTLVLDPPVRDSRARVAFPVRFRGTWLDITAIGNTISVYAHPGGEPTVRLEVLGRTHYLQPGHRREFAV